MPEIRLIICRQDLPKNELWREKGYPYENCWEPDELMIAGEKNPGLLPEARRIYWECYWRLLGRYKGARPFFDTYMQYDSNLAKWGGDEAQVCRFVVASAMATQVVPEQAKRATFKLYKRLFKESAERQTSGEGAS
ncbi:MAG: hypothetical protein QW794_00460 [Thermosphaera sp.]